MGVYHRPLGVISRTKTPLKAAETLKFFKFQGDIRYLWGGYQIPLGGISDTFGGDIRYQNTPEGRRKTGDFEP